MFCVISDNKNGSTKTIFELIQDIMRIPYDFVVKCDVVGVVTSPDNISLSNVSLIASKLDQIVCESKERQLCMEIAFSLQYEDWTINAASRVLTRIYYSHI
ncbi:hypothetical protein DPMN_133509 [Dreissena polymorpha]|uniref:Uncharacterized protein n=1 Tax=Dreissena polymorpha TaxID=45954 RepID=A0A9D4FVH4_DREPO|nr:hypothetical protein DPMN_133509 [Dreissena polymorpha]